MAELTSVSAWAAAGYTDYAESERRRWIVRLTFLIYWLLIFEGVLRKWLLPDAFQVLFFIRAPFVLAVYTLALFNSDRLVGFRFLYVWLGLAVSAVIVGVSQLLSGGADAIKFTYGLHNYFWHIPLAFIIGSTFEKRDLERLCGQTLFLSIPIAVLVYVQYTSPISDPVNAGFVAGGLDQAGLVEDIPRTFGTFTSSSGQTMFIASAVAMLVARWSSAGFKGLSGAITFTLALIASAVSLVMSGSRSAFVLVGVILFTFFLASIVLAAREKKPKRVVTLLLSVLCISMTVYLVLGNAVSAMLERTESAFYLEQDLYGPLATFGRMGTDVTNFISAIPKAPTFGYGIGSFGNAFASETALVLSAEDDWSRNIYELGPALGLVFIGLRTALAFWLARRAFVVAQQSRRLWPLVCLSFIGVTVFSGQITAQGSINGYGWLFTGICIAASRLPASGQTGALQS